LPFPSPPVRPKYAKRPPHSGYVQVALWETTPQRILSFPEGCFGTIMLI
jgi:hypothetical protein